MPSLDTELSLEETRLAQQAAASLTDAFGPEFAEQVEVAVISGKLPERRDFAVDPVSLIGVLIAAVGLAWKIWYDWKRMRTSSQNPDKSEVVKAVLEALGDTTVNAEDKLTIVNAVVENLE
jgi:hypothetical protein